MQQLLKGKRDASTTSSFTMKTWKPTGGGQTRKQATGHRKQDNKLMDGSGTSQGETPLDLTPMKREPGSVFATDVHVFGSVLLCTKPLPARCVHQALAGKICQTGFVLELIQIYMESIHQ